MHRDYDGDWGTTVPVRGIWAAVVFGGLGLGEGGNTGGDSGIDTRKLEVLSRQHKHCFYLSFLLFGDVKPEFSSVK